jgi:hypothetical protein
MLYTQHVSGIIMPIMGSTVKDDKPQTVFCTVTQFGQYTHGPYELALVCVTVQNTECGLSSFAVLLMMCIMMPETR